MIFFLQAFYIPEWPRLERTDQHCCNIAEPNNFYWSHDPPLPLPRTILHIWIFFLRQVKHTVLTRFHYLKHCVCNDVTQPCIVSVICNLLGNLIILKHDYLFFFCLFQFFSKNKSKNRRICKHLYTKMYWKGLPCVCLSP